MTADSIVELKITLDNVTPTVRRRIEVPLNIRLDRLHEVLQAAMGWANNHLYEFRIGGVGWGMPDPDWPDGPLDARKARLIDILEDTGARAIHYLYDFGDSWEHTIKIGRINAAVQGLLYPCLIDSQGRCPPEDIGGPWGYGDCLDAIADPNHERHAECLEQIGADFDANLVDAERHVAALQSLAQKWARKTSVKKK